MDAFLPLLFFMVAIIYSAVGFGGASSYTALLVIFGTLGGELPIISLTCNIIVVSGGIYHFVRSGHPPLRIILPLLAVSIPAAFLGGGIAIPLDLFLALLGLSLFAAAVAMFVRVGEGGDNSLRQLPTPPALALGATLGFVSGLSGIGGGIFLSPILHLLRWGSPKRIASTCALFILANSLAGLGGQIVKQPSLSLHLWTDALPLFAAVLLGSQIGSVLGAGRISAVSVKNATAVLVMAASLRLLGKVLL